MAPSGAINVRQNSRPKGGSRRVLRRPRSMDSTSVNQEITRSPEYLGFISEIISHLAWPVTVLIMAILLRKHLGNLLSSITKLKFRDFELETDFKHLAESAEMLPVAEAPRQPMSEPNQTFFTSFEKQVMDIATHAPSAAILLAWTGVETAMASAVSRMSISPDPPSMRSSGHTLDCLRRFAGLPIEVGNLIDEMRILRNKVAHDENHKSSILTESAVAYGESAVRVINFLNGFESRSPN